MRNKDILKAIELWQKNEGLHSLTCEYNSDHKPLIGVEKAGHIFLYCEDCTYCQEKIPEVVFEYYLTQKNQKVEAA